MTARLDSNSVLESLHGARAADREREIELYRVDAREDLIETLLAGQSIGRYRLRLTLADIFAEWMGVDTDEPIRKVMEIRASEGDNDAKIGDFELWLRDVAERYLDAHPDRIETRAEEMLAEAREAYDEGDA